MRIPTTHPDAALTAAIAGFSAALGAPVEYSNSHPRWVWGEHRGPHAINGLHVDHAWRRGGALVCIVRNADPWCELTFWVDESAPEMPIAEVLDRAHHIMGIRSAPLRSLTAAVKWFLDGNREW